MRILRFTAVVAMVALLCAAPVSAADNGRTEKITLPPNCYNEVPTLDCGDFLVLADWCEVASVMIRYDSYGNPVQAVYHWEFGSSVYYNSEDPTIMVEGRREHSQNRLLIQDNILYSSGPTYRVIIPGEGVVALDTGHWMYDFNTGEVTYIGGPHQVTGGDASALCEALAQ